MKKLLLVMLLVLTGLLSVQAQENKSETKSYDYYCQYWGALQGSGWIKPQKMIWDNQKKEVTLADENGKELEFNNMTDVMNYMSKRGWVLDNVVVHNSWFYYIFKKRVYSDKEAKDGLYFMTDFNKKQ